MNVMQFAVFTHKHDRKIITYFFSSKDLYNRNSLQQVEEITCKILCDNSYLKKKKYKIH